MESKCSERSFKDYIGGQLIANFLSNIMERKCLDRNFTNFFKQSINCINKYGGFLNFLEQLCDNKLFGENF